ncbi:hypothetical protein Sjap_007191 [Stephania japonica]|uniref:Uncharacterized protein n=1 Tax=Stephania japonica TaxID=461633 RepID=A0AAP0PA73_9MAGN
MSSLDYWLRWQVPVCALIILAPPIIAAILISRIQRAPIKASDLWIPCWRGLNPIWILLYRVSVFAFMAWMLSRVAAHDGPWAFFFYTQDRFLKVDEMKARTTLTSVPNNVGLDNQEDPVEAGFWGYLIQIIYQASAGASMLTDVVFWGLLFPFQSKGHFRLNPVSTSYLCA